MSIILSILLADDLVSIEALNTDDSKAIESVLGLSNRQSPLNERFTEHDVAGMAAKMDATFENSGVIS